MLIPDEAALQVLEASMPRRAPVNPIAERREFFSGTTRPAQTRQRLVPRLLPTPHPQPQPAPPVPTSQRTGWAPRALFVFIVLAAAASGYLLALHSAADPSSASPAPVAPKPGLNHAPPLHNYASPALGGAVVPQLTVFEQTWLEQILGVAAFDLQELVAARSTPLVCIPIKGRGSVTVKLAQDVNISKIVVSGRPTCRIDVWGQDSRFLTHGRSEVSFGGPNHAQSLVTIDIEGTCCVDGVQVWGNIY